MHSCWETSFHISAYFLLQKRIWAHLVLLYFTLLCFENFELFTKLRFVATLHWVRLRVLFFQQRLLTSCLFVIFGNSHNISNFSLLLHLWWWSVISDLWCYYCKKNYDLLKAQMITILSNKVLNYCMYTVFSTCYCRINRLQYGNPYCNYTNVIIIIHWETKTFKWLAVFNICFIMVI